MPRQNPTRSLQNERELARRVSYERQLREWTYEGLAKRLTDAGCPIQGSAIYKIEKDDPPRRITVNELVALGAVFELAVEELLVPVEFVENREAIDVLSSLSDQVDMLRHSSTKIIASIGRFLTLDVSDAAVRQRFDSVRRDPLSVDTYYLTPLPHDAEAPFTRMVTSLWRAAEARHRAGDPLVLKKNN